MYVRFGFTGWMIHAAEVFFFLNVRYVAELLFLFFFQHVRTNVYQIFFLRFFLPVDSRIFIIHHLVILVLNSDIDININLLHVYNGMVPIFSYYPTLPLRARAVAPVASNNVPATMISRGQLTLITCYMLYRLLWLQYHIAREHEVERGGTLVVL